MITVNIKPLSVNQAWQGKRYKTPKYLAYQQELSLRLPKISIPGGDLSLDVIVGYSSRGSDIDNFLKPFIDVMQKKYGFNDSRIYRLFIEKQIVKKGDEFISFKFYEIAEL